MTDDAEWEGYAESWEQDEDVAPTLAERPAPRSFGRWILAALRGLLDLGFQEAATRTLLPIVYVLGLLLSFALPIVLTVLVFGYSSLLGVLFAIFAAPLIGLSIASVVRLMLEFLININRLVRKVDHMVQLTDDLHRSLADVAVPMSQLSEDVRAVQFWRFGKRR